jgi:hypothetical protein
MADHISAEQTGPATQTHPSKTGEKLSFSGLEVGNWISLAALLLSLITAIWALTGYLIGAKVDLLPPTSVTFRYWPYGGDFLAITGTTMNYVNEGRKDYDALVISEQAELAFPGRKAPVKLDWWWFVDAFGRGDRHAHPIVVPGAGVATHETRFAPTLQRCPDKPTCPDEVAYANFFSWMDFLAAGKDEKLLPRLQIIFVAKVKEDNYREIRKSCSVEFSERGRRAIAQEFDKLNQARADGKQIEHVNEKKEYFSFPCVTQT